MHKLASLWKHFKDTWPDRFRQRVTGAGLAYTAAMLLVAVSAFVSANNLLFLVLAAMLSTFLLSGFVSRLGLAGLELDLFLPEHIAARSDVRASVQLRNLKRWIPSFSIHLGIGEDAHLGTARSRLYFLTIPGGAAVEEPLNLTFPRRGVYKERIFWVSTRFPFGFAERREQITVRHEVLVYPCLDVRPAFERLLASIGGEIQTTRRGSGSDFYRIRPYETLETTRHLDWKATAHTGELQVREYAQDEDCGVVIFLDLDTGDTGWFESAVECTAYLAHQLAAQGTTIRLRTQFYDVTSRQPGDIYTILKYLALVSPVRGKPPVIPDDTTSFQVVLSANPDRVKSTGWCSNQSAGSRLLSLPDLAPAGGMGPTEPESRSTGN